MLVRYIYFFTLLLCYCITSTAQSFKYRQYTTHQGLPIDNVYAAAQDNTGFIWFATDFGISKFDGYGFKNYNSKNGVATTAVIDIVNAGGDSMIFCSYPSTLQSISSKGKINTLHVENKFTIHLLAKHQNSVYYFQRGGKLFGIYQNGKATVVNADSLFKLKDVVINAIISLDKDGVGFCTNKGFFVQNNEGFIQYLHNQNVNYAIKLIDQSILAVCNHELFSNKGNNFFSKLPIKIEKDKNILHMAQDSSGTVWLRGIASGIYSLKNNNIKECSYQLNMLNKAINKFFVNSVCKKTPHFLNALNIFPLFIALFFIQIGLTCKEPSTLFVKELF